MAPHAIRPALCPPVRPAANQFQHELGIQEAEIGAICRPTFLQELSIAKYEYLRINERILEIFADVPSVNLCTG
jgi:hypothetical protein